MTFSLDNYVDVVTRLGLALKQFPDLRVQETHREIVEMPDKSCFIRCTVTVWRDGQDPIPSIASACEIYPGRTPYTKGSENEVGFTSALGRALGYMGFGIAKGLASRDEVQAAQSRQPIPAPRPAPRQDPDVAMTAQQIEAAFREPNQPAPVVTEFASAKQLGMIRAVAQQKGIVNLPEYCATTLGYPVAAVGDLSKFDASKIIKALQGGAVSAPVSSAPGFISSAQISMLGSLARGQGWSDEQRHAEASQFLGKEITSFKELLSADASKLITHMKTLVVETDEMPF